MSADSYEAVLREQRERHGAAQSTVDALMYSLYTRGVPALSEPNCQRRLAELSPDQVRQVIERLDRARSKWSAINDALLLKLAERIA